MYVLGAKRHCACDNTLIFPKTKLIVKVMDVNNY